MNLENEVSGQHVALFRGCEARDRGTGCDAAGRANDVL